MPTQCLNCIDALIGSSKFILWGSFYRTCDSRFVQRYRCTGCFKTCSKATFHKWFRQKKRRFNQQLFKHFASGGTIRRAAINFNLNRKTVEKKLELLGFISECEMKFSNLALPQATIVEFDDLETFEHTKCKPLSVTIAVESVTRRILGLEVSSMPAKGNLVKLAKKYGYRPDLRVLARKHLFTEIKPLVHERATIKSDKNPHYPADVKEHFPEAKHQQFLSRRGSLGGQGELKKGGFDPLFSLNHTCAMLRANVSRLFRKTWNTTKRADRLRAHLFLYAHYHNQNLPKAA